MIEEKLMQRILAIDYGLKRVGLALSDPLLTFAYPYRTIPNNQDLFKELGAVISGKNVKKIILGHPIKESGEDSAITKSVLKFKEELEKRINIEILLRDERYTSSMAREIIKNTVSKKEKRKDKGLVDMSSAAIILQDYLDEK